MTRLYLARHEPDEDAIHESVARALDVLLKPPAVWCHYPAGAVQLPKAAAAKLYRLGLRAGWPDILILHGGLYGIELKDRTGRLSKTRIVHNKATGRARVVLGQEQMLPILAAAGMTVAVCRSLDAVLAQVRAWQIPMREVAA